MNKISVLESRLGKLEQDNRRLKMGFGSMLLLFATVALIGMAVPQQIPDVISAHEFHATMLHLLGMDHTQLTYRYNGRDMRLTDVHGEIAHQIIA